MVSFDIQCGIQVQTVADLALIVLVAEEATGSRLFTRSSNSRIDSLQELQGLA